MPEDLNINYSSTGFEAVNGQLSTLESRFSRAPGWTVPFNTTVKEASEKGSQGFQKIGDAAQGAIGKIESFLWSFTKITTVVTAVNGLLAGAGVYAFGRWSEGMLKATESNRTMEASLKSVLGTQEAFQKVSQFARGAAASSSDTTYAQTLETAKRFALLPGTQPIYEQGNVEWMKRIEGVVSGLARMFPQEGRTGAEEMVQGALMGMWRRFELQTGRRPEELAQGIGMGKEEMEGSSLNILKALESVTKVAPQITTLTGLMNKLKGSYHEWLETIGNAGIYEKVLGYLGKFNEWFQKTFSGSQGKGFATAINQTLESIADGIAKIFTT